MFCCFVLLVATAEAQRGSETGSGFIYLPDAYDGERGILISSGCQAAAVGGISAPQFFVTASRPYVIRGWNVAGVNLSAPLGSGAGGLALHYEGFEEFRRWQGDIVYAKKLSETWLVGAGFAFTRLQVAGVAAGSSAGYRAAIQYRPTEKMALAAELGRSPGIASPYQNTSILPASFRLEWWVRISPAAQTFLLVQKNVFSAPTAAIVLKYIPHEKVTIRIGLDAPVASFWLGVGFDIDSWKIELNMGMHPYLGATGGAGGGRIM